MDRVGAFMIFLVFGPLLLVMNVLVDFAWFFVHTYN